MIPPRLNVAIVIAAYLAAISPPTCSSSSTDLDHPLHRVRVHRVRPRRPRPAARRMEGTAALDRPWRRHPHGRHPQLRRERQRRPHRHRELLRIRSRRHRRHDRLPPRPSQGPRRADQRLDLAGALVDSIAFPTIAFGSLLWSVVFGQFTAKVAGGVLVTVLLVETRKRALHWRAMALSGHDQAELAAARAGR